MNPRHLKSSKVIAMNTAVQAWGATDIGRVRQSNEDSFGIDLQLGLIIVADGMGGHAGGAHASRRCVELCSDHLRAQLPTLQSPAEQLPELLSEVAQLASQTIFREASQNPALSGMGTTLTAALILDGKAHIVHVGDSRCYLIRGGHVQLITDDHSWVFEQVQAGILSQEEAEASEFKHVITRSIGFEAETDPDVYQRSLEFGDVLLLCSDGFSNYATLEDIAALAQDHYYADLPQACVELALERGGEDNITVLCALYCNQMS